jgi:antitoxin component of MazEF toxin-antitoxin module
VKLQENGNSMRATIPKQVVEELSISQGQDMSVAVVDNNSILIRKRKSRAGKEKVRVPPASMEYSKKRRARWNNGPLQKKSKASGNRL